MRNKNNLKGFEFLKTRSVEGLSIYLYWFQAEEFTVDQINYLNRLHFRQDIMGNYNKSEKYDVLKNNYAYCYRQVSMSMMYIIGRHPFGGFNKDGELLYIIRDKDLLETLIYMCEEKAGIDLTFKEVNEENLNVNIKGKEIIDTSGNLK